MVNTKRMAYALNPVRYMVPSKTFHSHLLDCVIQRSTSKVDESKNIDVSSGSYI